MLPITSRSKAGRVLIYDKHGKLIKKKSWLYIQLERIDQARLKRVIEKGARVAVIVGKGIAKTGYKYTRIVVVWVVNLIGEIIFLMAMQLKAWHMDIKRQQKDIARTKKKPAKKVEIIITETKITYYE